MSTFLPTLHGLSILDGYAGFAPGFDEMVGTDGSLRPHWRTFASCLEEMGQIGFGHRWEEARQIIRENGVTYNVYGDPSGSDRPWQLDPLPFIISPAESQLLQMGLGQRARLLEAVLADLLGPQKILAQGLLPPELVFANPGFLRPCHGIVPPGNRFLHLVGFDVGRGRDGNLCVLGERTQAPSGAGYALENRIVLARMLPEVFGACNVERLALFFRNLRDTLRGLAPHHRDSPRIVLLTPGPFNETYFEHAYLARYLGITLVEGGDLTVRDHHLYLKLLDGLQPVDVVWRRLDDDFCDPLELRGDSFLGIPGLLQAVRAGNVVVANALGSGLTESAALLPYLPGICQFLLGEPLRMPSVPAYWCGDPAGLDHVLNHFQGMVIKGAFPAQRFEPIFPENLGLAQRQQVIDRIRANPSLFIGQEHLDLSTMPVLTEAGVQPRHVAVRFYLAANDGGFAMMPGGLTRVTASTESMVVSLQKGGGSKDTWVVSEEPVSDFSLLRPRGRVVELSRGGNDLPSRAADNLFWLGRYVERAEDMVRLLRGIFVRLTEKSGLAEVPELPVLLRALTQITKTLPGFVGDDAPMDQPEVELYSLIFQPDRIGSLAYNFQCIQRSAASVRDRISMDMWRTLSSLPFEEPFDPHEPPTLGDVLDLLNQRVIGLAGFGGMATESMTRAHGWRFLDMGRKVERAQHIATLFRHTLAQASANEGPLLEALLEIADSSMTYRRRYLAGVQAAPVLDLLLADAGNPRSLLFQMISLQEVIEELPRDPVLAGRSPEERLILALRTYVELADIEELVGVDEFGQRPRLEDLLARIDKDLPHLSDAIAHHYLSHLQASRQLAGH